MKSENPAFIEINKGAEMGGHQRALVDSDDLPFGSDDAPKAAATDSCCASEAGS
jgi:hypothetical protein